MSRRFLLGAFAALLAAPISILAMNAGTAKLGSPFVFELSMSGKSWDTGVILPPGVKPPIGNVKNGDISKVLKGSLPDYADDFLDLDPNGKFYLYYDGKSSWRVATNPDGLDTTTLNGQVANDGQFWMAGNYGMFLADADVFCQGKVKFKKGTFEPTKVSGKFFLVSEAITTGLTLSFKTVGKPIIVP